MSINRIVMEVSDGEFERISKLRDGKTWRELFLPPLGIETKRHPTGPSRKRTEEAEG